MVRHVSSWFIMFRHGSCFVMVCDVLSWFCDVLSWFVMFCHGSCFIMVRDVSSWFVMFRHGSIHT